MLLQNKIRALQQGACSSQACRQGLSPALVGLQRQQAAVCSGKQLRRVTARAASGDDDVPAPSPRPPAAPVPSPSPPAARPPPSALQQRAEAALDLMGDRAARPSVAASASKTEPTTRPPEQQADEDEEYRTPVQKFLFPDQEELPDNLQLPIWDHLEELRERVLVAGLSCVAAIATCFAFSKDLVVFLEAPVADAGVRFLQLSPGEFFFTTLKTAGYAGLLVAAPTVLYEIIAYAVPGLTKSERQFLAPIIFGSSVLFYLGILFSYEILTPAALNFFVDYADGAVESLWSIDQYFEFVLVLMLSTGLAFQVPVIQVMLGQLGLVTSQQMLSQWRYVVVGSTIVAAVLTPSTDPFTQSLLAIPLVGLYMGGATLVKVLESRRALQP